jgi:MFS transporter, LPLT family, lysophospholipid transporter
LNRGFHLLIAAQFVSGLADNALLLVAIARMSELGHAAWLLPCLKLVFTVAYVAFAPFVGPFADAMPKGRVMLLANGMKIGGCLLLMGGVSPLIAFCVVGLGAAAYSPAKYGLVTELLPASRLVAANGWLEVTTVGGIILGTVLGGALVSPALIGHPWAQAWPGIVDGARTALLLSMTLVLLLYALAAVLNAGIPDSGVRYPPHGGPMLMMQGFVSGLATLWRDPMAQVSMAVTTMFWGIGAMLQFLLLRWGAAQLDLGLDQAAYLQGVTAVGITAGAAAAGRWVPLRSAASVLPLGVAMGLCVPVMTGVQTLALAVPLMVAVGAMAGFFVVPMNALLQHRGYCLLSAGRSIAVQNFNENLSVLVVLALYAGLVAADVSLDALIWGFGLCIAALMAGVTALHRRREHRRRSAANASWAAGGDRA